MAGKMFPLVCTSGAARHRHPAAARRDRQLRAVARPSASSRRSTPMAAELTIRPSDTAPYAAFVWKTIADPFAGRITMLRVVTGHAEVGHERPQRHPRRTRERFGHLLALQGKTQTQVPELKAGDLGAVAKLKDTHTNDVLAEKTAKFTRRADQVPGSRCWRTRSSRRAAATRTRSAASMQRLKEEDPSDQLHPRSADPRAAARRAGPAAHRGDGRQAEAPVRRRGEPEAAADPLPRDDHRRDRGARPPQEADRRPRPVRRLQDQGGAAAARQRFRVRRRHLRRLDPAAVHSGRRKGHPGRADARLPRRLPDGRLPGDGLRRVVPSGRLERAVVQDGGLAGVQGRHDPRPADDPRADHARRGLLRRAISPAT